MLRGTRSFGSEPETGDVDGWCRRCGRAADGKTDVASAQDASVQSEAWSGRTPVTQRSREDARPSFVHVGSAAVETRMIPTNAAGGVFGSVQDGWTLSPPGIGGYAAKAAKSKRSSYGD
jgi:hypothetical protein